ncbi:Smg-4/UPF3 family-domain-containing protein [Coprinopsis sp. MPI-PUGE-AT-0042]|nr:Smg-4/UPF3 family-domain-containing protein [Coprinopsis sp. MPI-PUGE-AT-0042]
MAPAAPNAQPPAKSKKEKEREKRERAAQQQTERLKVVVRRLPPNLPEDIFWQTVQKWVTEETATWKVFYPGKFKKRDNKENIPSRAYVAFKDDLALATFSQEFDGHLFRDKAGNESYAIVEFAPYQKVPPEKKKPDNKNATIEKDEDYISFIQSLNAPANAEPVTIDSLLAATRPASPPKTTPLLEALKAEKSAQKDKEAILRNHAHYKDQANVTVLNGLAGSSRKEEKKKAVAQAQAAKQQPAPTPAASGKKGKKAKETPSKPSAPVNKGTNAAQESKGASASGPSAPKPPRQPKQPKAAPANPAPAPAAPVTIVQAPKPPPADVPAPEAVATKPAGEPAGPAAPPARRMRPMFSGRNFEAALAGVGARPKRERPEGNAPPTPTQPQAASSTAEAAGAPTADPSDSKEKNPTASPPRSRNRRGGAPAASASNPGPKAAPAVLQRDPGTVNGSGSPTAANASLPPATPADRGGRGGRRGRGRGGGAARGAPRGG